MDGFDEIAQATSQHYGVGFAVTSWLAQSIICYWSVSDRVIVIQVCLSGKSILTVSNVYGPTAICYCYNSKYGPQSVHTKVCWSSLLHTKI